MPLKQLLELLETTADDTSHMAPRLRRREASPPASHQVPEPTYFRS